ncbi:FAD-dependent oxidoreductase, partial [Candidatus Saccharibacteria bacterium]|nr:FAD-dependent oxidoreductase [Candidatus Saccharibacteria bacterium]
MTHVKTKTERYDLIVLGAGIFGLYAAKKAREAGKRVLVVDRATEPFAGASYINQARIHSGYHYPRSRSTAIKTAAYMERFVRDFDFAIHKNIRQI